MATNMVQENADLQMRERRHENESVRSGLLSEEDNRVPETLINQNGKSQRLGWIKRITNNHKGLILVLLACLCRSLNAMTIKTLAGRIPSFQIVFCRQMSLFLYSSNCIIFSGIRPSKIPRRDGIFLVSWILSSTMTICLVFYAVQLIPAGDVTAILLSRIIVTGILAWLVLGERFTCVDAALAVLMLLGVILIARPSFIFGALKTARQGSHSTPGVAAVLAAAVVASVVTVSLRKLGKSAIHPFYQLWYFSVASSVLIGALTSGLEMWEMPRCGEERVILFLAAVLGVIANILTLYALKIEKAAYVVMFSTNAVILTFTLEFIFFGTIPHWLSVVGAGVIVFSTLAVTIYKMKSNKS